MRKEIPIAVIGGSLVGLVIAYGVWRANIALRGKDEVADNNSQQEEVKNNTLGLTIAKPTNFSVFLEKKATISGVSQAGYITISGEESDTLFKTNSDGGFEKEIPLTGGVNEVKVNTFSKEEAGESANLIIIYTSKLGNDSPKETENEATDTADVVRQKIAEITENPVYYIGVVTDISESGLQISKMPQGNEKGEIEQISIDKVETTFSDITKTTKDIKFTDIAIGDNIIAMGFKGENEVLSAKRILVSGPIEKAKRIALIGELTKVDGHDYTIKTNDSQFDFTTDRNTDITYEKENETSTLKESKIEVGNKVIVTLVDDDGEYMARVLHILP